MADAVTRFSNRVDNYVRYRPNYPPGLIDILKSDCGLEAEATVADIGSGTGILSEMFLKNGNLVVGVEPNEAMRKSAERLLVSYPKFKSVSGTAEATTLAPDSVDFITAAQAFHWFDRAKAKKEFSRILKPQGWVVLVWNERRLDSTPFLRTYEKFLLRYGTDYEKVRHENVAAEIGDFFEPRPFRLKTFENFQHFDFEALRGRLFSASYVPAPDHPCAPEMLAELRQIFDAHQAGGIVSFEYDTRVFYGQLT